MNQQNFGKYIKLRYALILVLLISVIGVLGYMTIEKIPLLDAIYMTVITISTVGFKEAISLSIAGKIFTIILIIVSWISFAFAITVITSVIVESEVGAILNKYRSKRKLKNMKDHVIIVGYGRNGRKVAEDLEKIGEEFVIIERNHELIMNSEHKDRFMEGDATNDDVLLEAGIKNAKAIISSLPVDADNLFVVVTARNLNPDFLIISRASELSTQQKLRVAGANKVIMPEFVGGSYMASVVVNPGVVDFVNQLSITGEADTNLTEIECDELPDSFKNKTISDLQIRQKTGANLVGFKTPDGKFTINPGADTKLVSHSKIFFLGSNEQISKLKDFFKS